MSDTQSSQRESGTSGPSRLSRLQGFLDMLRRNKWVIGLTVLAVLAVVLLSAVLPRRDHSGEQEKREPQRVDVMLVEPLEFYQDMFEIPGIIEPNRVVDVAAEVSARVERFAEAYGRDGLPLHREVEEGDWIQKGQPIVHLNTELLDAALKRAKANSEFAEAELKRYRDLFERDVATQAELEQIQMQAQQAQAALAEAQALLDRAKIIAPISGVLNKLPIEEGEYLQPGMAVAEIVDRDRVKVVLDVPEADVGYLSLGQEEVVNLPHAHSDQPDRILAKITYISEIANERARTTRVELTADNERGLLRSGQIVRVEMQRRRILDAIMVPLDAMFPVETGNSVEYVAYVVEEGTKAVKRSLRIDLDVIQGKDVLVTSGLKGGEKLIVQGQRYVGPGQTVAVRERRDDASPSEAAQKQNVEAAVPAEDDSAPAGGSEAVDSPSEARPI